MWTELSDTAILSKLGTRLKAYRISRGLKQQELASESGVGISTIAKIESGQSVSFSLLISVMRTLGLLENLYFSIWGYISRSNIAGFMVVLFLIV